jgi:hypothetical protein
MVDKNGCLISLPLDFGHETNGSSSNTESTDGNRHMFPEKASVFMVPQA